MPENANVSLLRRFVATRDEAAFAEIVRRQLDGVYSAALRRVGGDTHLAEDVAQLVFVALSRKAATVAGGENLTGWLYGATRNEAANVVRSERRRKAREQEAHIMNEVSRPAANEADWSRVAPVLDAAIDELGENDRAAILARFVERRAFGEIGAALRVSEDAARMRVERALEKLRGRLMKRGVTSTGTALGVALANHAVLAAPVGLAGSVTGGALAVAVGATAGVGAATGGGSVVAWVSFMSTSKIGIGVAAFTLAVVVGGAGWEWLESRGAAEAMARARRENAVIAAQRREWEGRAEAAEQRRVAQAVATAEQRAKALAAAQARRAESKKNAEKTAAETEGFMARHPEFRRAALAYRRAEAAGTYRAFFKKFNLSPTEIERCLDLMARGSAGDTGGGEPVRYNTGGSREAAQRELKALLGEQRFGELTNYFDALGPAWQLTNQVAGSLYDTTAPLTAEQGGQLLEILSENRTPASQTSGRSYDWVGVLEKARRVLSAEQVATLEAYRAQDEFSRFIVPANVKP